MNRLACSIAFLGGLSACSFSMDDQVPRVGLAASATSGLPQSAVPVQAGGGRSVAPTVSDLGAVDSFVSRRCRLGLGLGAGVLDPNTDTKGDSYKRVNLSSEFGFRLSRSRSVQVELGALAQLGLVDLPASLGGDATLARLGPQVRVYFNAKNRVQPWVGAAFGASSYRDDFGTEIGGFYRVGAGVSVFTSSWTAFDIALQHVANEWESGSGFADNSDSSLSVGISTFF